MLNIIKFLKQDSIVGNFKHDVTKCVLNKNALNLSDGDSYIIKNDKIDILSRHVLFEKNKFNPKTCDNISIKICKDGLTINYKIFTTNYRKTNENADIIWINKDKLKKYVEHIFGRYITENTNYCIDKIIIKDDKNNETYKKYLFGLILIDNIINFDDVNKHLLSYYNDVFNNKHLKIELDMGDNSKNNFIEIIDKLLKRSGYKTYTSNIAERYNIKYVDKSKLLQNTLIKTNELYNLGYNKNNIKSIFIE